MTDRSNAPGDEGARPLAYPRQSRWRERNPIARAAHEQVRAAKMRGHLIPEACAWPGCTSTETEAHHPDYEHPLEVEWLCRRHHRETHRRMKAAPKGMGVADG